MSGKGKESDSNDPTKEHYTQSRASKNDHSSKSAAQRIVDSASHLASSFKAPEYVSSGSTSKGQSSRSTRTEQVDSSIQEIQSTPHSSARLTQPTSIRSTSANNEAQSLRQWHNQTANLTPSAVLDSSASEPSSSIRHNAHFPSISPDLGIEDGKGVIDLLMNGTDETEFQAGPSHPPNSYDPQAHLPHQLIEQLANCTDPVEYLMNHAIEYTFAVWGDDSDAVEEAVKKNDRSLMLGVWEKYKAGSRL
ncbi:hypothetical protein CANCADRAFT_44927 [Tortispora caseinolytica NRRL Y-17796]|uniref:Uncharacterized protein n=1 Tax=Tortispora caseinolytica NRRL Y-17796 TaxID=767744 RepID=A0A1E4TI25_9ASCO|nr:hypothetical protein CANCADRAFT_44927 [Tortispora caseinolytica NRRL Y-17796]